MLAQYLIRVICKFALPYRLEAGPLGCQIKPSDPGEEG